MILWPHIGLAGDFELCEENIIAYLNRNFMLIDSIMQMKVLDFVENLPISPEQGDIYILESTGYQYSITDSEIVIFDGSKWIFVEPKPGFIAFVESIGDFFWFNGTDWVILPKSLGDVSGPSSSLNNSIARFDGVTGKFITDSGVTLDDDRVISGASSVYSDNLVTENLISDIIYVSSSDNSTSSTSLSAPTTGLTRLTGALTEISSIGTPAISDKSSIYVYENRTGGRITVRNNSNIRTGTGKDLDLKEDSSIYLVYSNLSSQWIVIGGSGGSGEGVLTVPDISERNNIPVEDRYLGMIVYVESEKTYYTLRDGILNTQWDSLAFPQHIHETNNLIPNPRGEFGTNGWSLVYYGAGAKPSGTPAPYTGSEVLVSSLPNSLSGLGKNRLQIQKFLGINGQGVAAETSMPIPEGYRSSVLNIKVLYKTNSADFIAGSDSQNSSLIWYCAESSDGGTTWSMLEPSSFKILSKGIPDTLNAYVQVGPNTTHLKLIAYISRTETTAWSFVFEASVSKTSYAYGSIITASDYYKWTPTVTNLGAGSGTAVGVAGRVGDRLVGTISFLKDGTNGTNTGSNTMFSLYPGLIVDGLKIGPSVGSAGPVGVMSKTGATGDKNTWAAGNTSYIIGVVDGVGALGSFYSAGTTTTFEFSIPIQGWSSGAQLADGYDGREVSLRALGVTGSMGTLGTTRSTVIYSNVESDTVAGYNPVTGKYRIKTAGYYDINASIQVAGVSATVSGETLVAYISKNGSTTDALNAYVFVVQTTGVNMSPTLRVTAENVYLKAEDTIEIHMVRSSGLTGATYSNSSNNASQFTISKSQGSSYMSPTATVACVYRGSNGAAIPAATDAPQTYIPSIRTEDTHNMMNLTTGIITIPESGFYAGYLSTGFSAATSGATRAIADIQVYAEDGVTMIYTFAGRLLYPSSPGTGLEIFPQSTMPPTYLKQGQKVKAVLYPGGVNAASSFSVSGSACRISVWKVK